MLFCHCVLCKVAILVRIKLALVCSILEDYELLSKVGYFILDCAKNKH